MPDFYMGFTPYQASSPPTLVMDYLFSSDIIQGTSQACIVDVVPPVFAGITGLTIESGNQFRATWAAGTDTSLPIRYEVYIRPDSSSGLFNLSNTIAITDRLQFDIFNLPDGSFLVPGVTYYVGVRAIDAVGNRNTNTVILSAVSPGLGITGTRYTSAGSFYVDENGKFRGVMWGLKNANLLIGSLLGLGKYEIYDRSGALVSGMTQSNIVADPITGQFHLTPITSTLSFPIDQYLVRLEIVMDGAVRTSYQPLVRESDVYEAKAQFSIDALNRFQGTLWATLNGAVRSGATLGTASYAVFDATGAAVPSLSQSGIAADGNGRFTITAASASVINDLTHYTVRIGIMVDGVERVSYRGFSLLG